MTAIGVKLQRAIAHHQRGQLAEADALYREILAEAPAQFDALHLLGVLQTQLGDHQLATMLIRRAIMLNPAHAVAHSNLGLALHQLRRFTEALASFDAALAIDPAHAAALYNRGNALRELKRPADALNSYDRALAQKPDHADALCNRGNALRDLKRPADALASYERALALKPDDADALFNRGNALLELGRPAEALASYERALSLKPDDAEAWFNRGNALLQLKRREDALASYDRALALKANHLGALNNRGIVLMELKRPGDALASYGQALEIKPDNPEVLNNRGYALQDLQRYDEAARSFAELVARVPDYDYAAGSLLECRLHCCDWTSVADDGARLVQRVEAHQHAIAPFAFLAISDVAAVQLECARIFVADKFPPATLPMWTGERYRHDRIRLAYLSADFREHPLTHLTAELFERHDRQRFETIALSFGPNSPDEMRSRLERAFDRFIEVREQGDGDVANLLRTLEIDIAVDLTGFTAGARTGVLALRPAPIQVNYLGFPGTMGAGYIDYIVADRFVIPETQRIHYEERVVYLPDTFQANNSARPISARIPSRAEAGLPEGFVFCSFNTNYKIAPAVFDIWMRLLHEVEGSVLWLVGGNASVEANLQREAKHRGVPPERVVFARRVPFAEHLARYRLADLFLDTLPFNAGTTASDALWAGLPVLTCSGEAFAARMAGSLLNAIGLPELVTHSFDHYEALALELATDIELLPELKRRLARNRDRFPLFDTDRFRRHIETAYIGMWERYQQGLPPISFAVESNI